MLRKSILLLLFFVLLKPTSAFSLTGEEILKKIDYNLISNYQILVIKMTVYTRQGDIQFKSKSWSMPIDKKYFTEFQEPAREKGTKILKLKEDLWTYSPQTDRIITIAGHMSRQSLMGSDLSYEDYMNDDTLTNMYTAKITGEETINDRKCFVMKLIAKNDSITYQSRKVWVDKKYMIPLKSELYAKSGKLLKWISVSEVMHIQDRYYPKRSKFKDVLKIGNGTEFIVESIDFLSPISKYKFSKSALR